jgi:cell division protein FtsL
MLANRQQEIAYNPLQQQRVNKAATAASPRPDTSLKRNFMLLILLVIVAAMLITVQSQITVQAGYDLVQLKAQAATLEKQNELLRLDVARLSSPERIQQIASRDLGMVVPVSTYYADVPAKSAGASNVARAGQENGISIMSTAEASTKN